MIISDLNYVEVAEATEVKGGAVRQANVNQQIAVARVGAGDNSNIFLSPAVALNLNSTTLAGLSLF